MSLYKTEAIVLRTRPIGEADVIVTFYTRAEGKVEASARGARRPRSRLMGCIQPFTHEQAMFFRGRGMDSLSQGEILDSFRGLREDLFRMAYGSYILELADLSAPERQAHEELFELLLGALRLMAALPVERNEQGVVRDEQSVAPKLAELERITRVFELRLMRILGYEPQLQGCVACGGEVPSNLRFSATLGGVLCPNCFSRDPQALAVGRGTVETMRALLNWPWPRLAQVQYHGEIGNQLKRLLRAYIDFRLDRRLKSLDFLETLMKVNETH
ncbi:MAG: DNA repair protein RecO [Firmicutes bacterium]|nr:DNA repair protein RecO [Bacillota bacterium]